MPRGFVVVAVSLLALGNVGCFGYPSKREVRSLFQRERAAFQELRQMMEEDAAGLAFLAIGRDHLRQSEKGDTSHFEWWSGAVPYEVVQREVGVSEARFARYLVLLDEVGSERVEYFTDKGVGTTISLLMGTQGIAVSGCSMSVNHAPRLPPDPEEFQTYVPLADGWYIDEYCT